jgi:outer membrane protein assembly factor BamB
MGQGYSAPVFAQGKLFLTGDVGEHLVIFSMDLQGQILWRATNGVCWKNPYPGARALCTLQDGRLFHMNAHGRLGCFDPETGRELWQVNVLERFKGQNITWAISECVVIDQDKVIVTPGGTLALMAALHVKTGDTVWASEPLKLGASPSPRFQRLAVPAGGIDGASYASPLLFTWGGRRYLVSCSQRHVFGVDADTGQLQFTRPFPTRYLVIAGTPVWCGDGFFITAPDTEKGGIRYRLVKRQNALDVEEVWSSTLDTCHGGVIYIGGRLFGTWYRREKGWACVDADTGQVVYQARDWPMGSMLFADQRLYGFTQEGEVLLLQPTSTQFSVQGRFRLIQDRVTDAWAHPVIHQGRLYLRYHDTLYCYDIRRIGN